MKLYRSLDEARGRFQPSAVTIGNFDGLHAGHRRLIERTLALASRLKVKPSALTFHPHPATVVAPERAPRLLMTPEERAAGMAALGIEQVLIQPFTREFSHLSPVEFARGVLCEALGARGVVVGDNFRFGSGQAGHTDTLQHLGAECGFVVDVVAGVRRRGLIISSSEIRRLILRGEVSRAARLLERWFRVEGPVVRGEGRGSRETVPTLNLADTFDVLPADGVYITTTTPGGASITNVGMRPTFQGAHRTIETFLLDPLQETPARIAVEFHRRLRAERPFANAEALRAQILRDVARARVWHARVRKLPAR